MFNMKTGGEGRFKEKVMWKSPVLWRAQNNIFFDLIQICTPVLFCGSGCIKFYMILSHKCPPPH